MKYIEIELINIQTINLSITWGKLITNVNFLNASAQINTSDTF